MLSVTFMAGAEDINDGWVALSSRQRIAGVGMKGTFHCSARWQGGGHPEPFNFVGC